MSFKDILVHVDNQPQCEARLETAINLCLEHDAHLVGLHVRHAPHVPAWVRASLGDQVQQLQDRYGQEAEKQAERMFMEKVKNAGLRYEWRDAEGDLTTTIAMHARYSDMVIVGQPNPKSEDFMGDHHLVDEIVFQAGRPVLVIPYAGRWPSVGKRVLVAWNSSRESTRVTADAMPMLKKADWVNVLAVNPHGGHMGHGDVPGADICLHLARHGVNAICQSVKAEDTDVGNTLLSRIADDDCDLLLMGAYGRSRLRAMILGAVTRYILDHMTAPVMFSH